MAYSVLTQHQHISFLATCFGHQYYPHASTHRKLQLCVINQLPLRNKLHTSTINIYVNNVRNSLLCRWQTCTRKKQR